MSGNNEHGQGQAAGGFLVDSHQTGGTSINMFCIPSPGTTDTDAADTVRQCTKEGRCWESLSTRMNEICRLDSPGITLTSLGGPLPEQRKGRLGPVRASYFEFCPKATPVDGCGLVSGREQCRKAKASSRQCVPDTPAAGECLRLVYSLAIRYPKLISSPSSGLANRTRLAN